VPESDDFACYSALEFDDQTLAIQLHHRGTRESCEKTAELISALSYNGPKKVIYSGIHWMPWSENEAGIKAGDAT
jgi:hypothetical protein